MIRGGRYTRSTGFTIVELLIVVVVIAILAAIVIVSYNGIKGRAEESVFKNDLASASKKLETLNVQNGDLYPLTLDGSGVPSGSNVTGSSSYTYVVSPDQKSYCLYTMKNEVMWIVAHNVKDPSTGLCDGATGVPGDGLTAIASTFVSKKLSLGNGQACQVYSASQIYCWGYGIYGKQGDGATTNNLVPTLVTTSGLMAELSITQVAVGADHVCSVASGQAFCWGSGGSGRFGNGATGTTNTTPVAVDTAGPLAGKTVTDISLGAHKTCLVASGTTYCMGEGMYGQLQTGNTAGQTYPTPPDAAGVLAGRTSTAVDARGFRSSCSVADGRGFCAGYNSNGGLGTGNSSASASIVAPITTSGPLNGKNVVAIQSGPWGSSRCALDDQGKVYCWGPSAEGQIGNGLTGMYRSPQAVVGPLASKTVKQIGVGDGHACAITTENELYCWGDNYYGQLGDGTTTNQLTPISIPLGPMAGKTLTDVAASGYIGGTYSARFTCAIASGETYCWGRNEFGNLGDGSTTSSYTPVRVSIP